MQFRYKLDFGFPVLTDLAKSANIDLGKWPALKELKLQSRPFRGDTTCKVADVVTRTFLTSVQSLTGAMLKQCTIFDTDPGSQSTLHKDKTSSDSSTWAINVTLDGDENLINQYRLNENDPSLQILNAEGLKVYKHSPTHQLVHSAPFEKHSVYLFNINEGHQAFNTSKTKNWVLITMRPGSNDNTKLTWEQVVKAFEPVIVPDSGSIPLI